MMKGVVTSYRRGRHTQNPYQVIVKFLGIDSKDEAKKLIGKRVVWITPNNRKAFVGIVLKTHGNKGAVRVRFKKGVPGQMIGDIVYLVENKEEYLKLVETKVLKKKNEQAA